MTKFTTTYTQTDECEPVFTIIFKTDDEEMYKKVQKSCQDMVDISRLRFVNEIIRNQINEYELKDAILRGGRYA